MDSLTQAALGAAIGQATLGRKLGKVGPIAGAIVATIPDLDVVLYAFYDSVDMLRIHRGFSHSFVFCLLAAVGLSVVIKQIKWFKTIALIRLWWFTFLCLVTHVLLDYCTAYGTQLLLPFSDSRLGLDTINVVDPLYTLPLLIGTLSGYFIPRIRPYALRINAIGLMVSTLYLAGTIMIKQNINSRFLNDLEKEKVEYVDVLTMPVGTASWNWYGVAATDSMVYLKQYHLLNEPAGATISFKRNSHLLNKTSKGWGETMKWFSKGFYTVVEHQDSIFFFNLQVDMRGMVATSTFTAPTRGYFWSAENEDGTYNYGSGSLDD
ncbi:MAG: inner membrane protein [Bacteroidia bacterium]|jgi:inner membrane protein